MGSEDRADFEDVFGVVPTGTLTVGVHAEADYLEAVGSFQGLAIDEVWPEVTEPGLTTLGDLPGEAVGAVAVRDLGTLFGNLYDDADPKASFLFPYEPFADTEGLRLPEDLEAVFGTDFAIAVTAPLDDALHAAGKVVTNDEERALTVLDRAVSDFFGETLTSDSVDGGYTFATSQDLLSRATSGADRLADHPAFARAVGDVEHTRAALYLDLNRILEFIPPSDEDADLYDPLEALGITATTGEDSLGFEVRLTVD